MVEVLAHPYLATYIDPEAQHTLYLQFAEFVVYLIIEKTARWLGQELACCLLRLAQHLKNFLSTLYYIFANS